MPREASARWLDSAAVSDAPPAAPRQGALPLRLMLVAFVCLAGISLWIYRAALTGPFISDDHLYVANNPFVTAPGWTISSSRVVVWMKGSRQSKPRSVKQWRSWA